MFSWSCDNDHASFKGNFVIPMMGLHIAYLNTKFDHPSFSHFRDMVGTHQNLNGSRDLTTPLSGIWFAIRWLAIAVVNLSTKFEVSISTHYNDMKGDTKYQK